MAIITFSIPTSNTAGVPLGGGPVVYDGVQVGEVLKVNVVDDEETEVTAYVEDEVIELIMLDSDDDDEGYSEDLGMAMARPLDFIQADVQRGS
jgi:hypothetical protein